MKPRILIVEDDVPIKEMYELKLKAYGLEVASAVDGVTGLELAKKFKPDLILLDLMMPKVDGFAVLEELIRDEGATFNQFLYGMALCCPSRASILRGQYPHNTTIIGNKPVPPFSVDLRKDMAAFKKLENKQVAKAILQLSRLKYGRPRELVEAEISQRAKL